MQSQHASSSPITKLAPGQKAPDFKLPATDDSLLQLSALQSSHKAVVILFLCNHCPYVQAYVPRLVALQKQFQKDAAFVAICSNDEETYPQDSFEHMKEIAKAWNLNFAYVRDQDQRVAKAYGAERTPEIFVLDSKGVCRYEGGIDDNFQNPDKVKDRPLHDAMEQVIQGRQVDRPHTWAIGCTIKWKKA